MFAEIVFPIPLDRKFSYSVPAGLSGRLKPGMRVTAPFGNGTRQGHVAALSDSPPPWISGNIPLKEVSGIVDDAPVFTEELLGLARWIRDMYVCSLGEALNMILNEAISPSKNTPDTWTGTNPENRGQKTTGNGPGGKVSVLTGLGRGALAEIYARLIRERLPSGNCLLLVPEILFLHDTAGILFSEFGKTAVGLWHGRMPAGERYACWRGALAGKYRIVLGTRSAVFLPLKNLGLVIVDGETDQSYREQQKPAYSAVDIAIKRAGDLGADLVLGSRMPSIETYYNLKMKKYSLLNIK